MPRTISPAATASKPRRSVIHATTAATQSRIRANVEHASETGNAAAERRLRVAAQKRETTIAKLAKKPAVPCRTIPKPRVRSPARVVPAPAAAPVPAPVSLPKSNELVLPAPVELPPTPVTNSSVPAETCVMLAISESIPSAPIFPLDVTSTECSVNAVSAASEVVAIAAAVMADVDLDLDASSPTTTTNDLELNENEHHEELDGDEEEEEEEEEEESVLVDGPVAIAPQEIHEHVRRTLLALLRDGSISIAAPTPFSTPTKAKSQAKDDAKAEFHDVVDSLVADVRLTVRYLKEDYEALLRERSYLRMRVEELTEVAKDKDVPMSETETDSSSDSDAASQSLEPQVDEEADWNTYEAQLETPETKDEGEDGDELVDDDEDEEVDEMDGADAMQTTMFDALTMRFSTNKELSSAWESLRRDHAFASLHQRPLERREVRRLRQKQDVNVPEVSPEQTLRVILAWRVFWDSKVELSDAIEALKRVGFLQSGVPRGIWHMRSAIDLWLSFLSFEQRQ